jgi:competence protein ComGC
LAVPNAQPSQQPASGLSDVQKVLIVLIVAAILILFTVPYLSNLPGVQTKSVNIVNGLITVNANSYEDYQFTLPSSATNVHVSGSFTASGGSGSDIIVYIMDSTEFTNWSTGHQVSTYYNSGQLTTSSFDVALPNGAGTYYVVYDNTYSLLSQKNVNTQVNLNYA